MIASVFKSGSDAIICHAKRETTLFVGTLTIVVSRFRVIAISEEICVACIHSFKLHRIFKHVRALFDSIGPWVMGAVIATIEVLTNNATRMATVTSTSAGRVFYIIFTLAAAILVCVIQLRLLFFAKTNLKSVNPAGSFGAQIELADYRKKHIKVALASGIFAILGLSSVCCQCQFCSSTRSPMILLPQHLQDRFAFPYYQQTDW